MQSMVINSDFLLSTFIWNNHSICPFGHCLVITLMKESR